MCTKYLSNFRMQYSNSLNNAITWAKNWNPRTSEEFLRWCLMLHYLEQRCINKNFKIRVAQGYYRTFKKPRSIKDRVAQGSVAQGPPVLWLIDLLSF